MKRRGGLTVFAALSVMLAASVLLALLEAARVSGMEQTGQLAADSALESVFAGYDRVLWDKYHLLVRSVGALSDSVSFEEVEREFSQLAEASMNPDTTLLTGNATDFFRSEVTDVAVNGYTLITDGQGDAFRSAVSGYMKQNLTYVAAQEIRQLYEKAENAQSGTEMTEDTLEEALSGASEGMEEARNASEGEDQEGSEAENRQVAENPITTVNTMKKTGILSLVLDAEAQISGNAIQVSDTVSLRSLDQGTDLMHMEDDWYETILVNQYYLSFFSDYLTPDKEGALQYGIEYLLSGKASDQANLKAAVGKLLLVRESCNLAFLVGNGPKQREALTMATALAGASANPAIIEAVKYGILVAWAYAESILDLRTLLQGGRIAIVKTADQWTSDLNGLSECGSSFLKAKDCSNGMDYKEYLGMLLYLTGSSKLAYRAMDLQELYARKQSGYENFRMDHMAIALSITVTYPFQPVFSTIITEPDFLDTELSIRCQSKYSYIKAGV